ETREGLLAFPSSATWAPGDGVSGASELCQSEADAADLDGTFRALLATSELSPLEVLFDLEPGATIPWPEQTWVRFDGVPIVDEPEDLLSGELLAPINVGLDGFFDIGFAKWTGAAFGLASNSGATEDNCNDWRDTTDALSGRAGQDNAVDVQWRSRDTFDCTTSHQLYCFQVE
ncbi:MAG: hypothetical protein KC561_10330, partial [Myxococcales bacterium]|nr:hypothetical protein [Myxococcales bacterium]